MIQKPALKLEIINPCSQFIYFCINIFYDCYAMILIDLLCVSIQHTLTYLAPFWRGAWDALDFVAGLMCFIFVVEILRPGRTLRWRTVLLNVLYAPIQLTLAAAVLSPISKAAESWLPNNVLGIHLPAGVSSASLLFFLAYLFFFDFLYYWFHRAQHSWPLLWRYHLMHHTDDNVSMISSVRHHWLEESLRYFVILAPMHIMFGGNSTLPLWMLVSTGLYGMVIHWNMPWHSTFLSRYIVTPRYHRLHHSIEPRHHDRNFAVFFPFLDRLFGTCAEPTTDEYPETGVQGVKNPNSLGLLLPWPLLPPSETVAQNSQSPKAD